MRNKLTFLIVIAMILAVGLGCSLFGSEKAANSSQNGSDKSSVEKTAEDLIREKTGVPECDELLDYITEQSKAQDDNFVTRAAKEFFFNKIRQSLKENIEQNKNDKEKMAKECREIRRTIESEKAKEPSNSK